MVKAEKAFTKTPAYQQYEWGDGWEPHIRLCYPEAQTALTKNFTDLANLVYGKMLEYHQGGKV